MGLNPFGEESDSIHAWKERYKQQQFQLQTMTGQLSELKSHLADLQIKFEETSGQLRNRELELTEAKAEMRATTEILKERERKIMELTKILETNQIDRVKEENSQLREEIELLQGRINRGDYNSTSVSSPDMSNNELSVALIPMMLKEYDPEGHNYQDAFVNLVEAVILHGDEMSKIIAILIKYGGGGPIGNLNLMVNSSAFEAALDALIEGGVVTRIDNQIKISSGEGKLTAFDWNTVETVELFEYLSTLTDSVNNAELISSLERFRDTLQNREIPLTTIFFEIRKIIERLQRDEMDRDILKNQISQWKEKYISLI